MNFAPHISPSKDAAAQAAAAHILERLAEARQVSRRATLAVSGGSTPRLMFQAMAAAGFDWADIHIFWVDERCVSPDHPDSNYRMTKEALLDSIAIAAGNVHRIQGEREPAEASKLYRGEIETIFGPAEKPAGTMPRFDVVHLGMGPDSHTASLFPGEEIIDDRARPDGIGLRGFERLLARDAVARGAACRGGTPSFSSPETTRQRLCGKLSTDLMTRDNVRYS